MKHMYDGLTRFLSMALLGILVGLVSSLVINVATGQKEINADYLKAIGCLFIAEVTLVLLLRWRQSMDDEFAKRHSLAAKDRWRASSRYDEPIIRNGYLSAFTVFLIAIFFAFWMIRLGNQDELKSQKTIDQQNGKQFEMIKQLAYKILQRDSLIFAMENKKLHPFQTSTPKSGKSEKGSPNHK